MSARIDRSPRGRQFLAALLAAQLLAILTLAVCPALHHWVHPDADGDEHSCAVTLFLSGGCNAPASNAAELLSPRFAETAVAPALPDAVWVASVFTLNRVFEHGPPSEG